MGKCNRPIETCQFKANCSGLKIDYASPNGDVPTGCSYLWKKMTSQHFVFVSDTFLSDSACNQFINREKTYQPVVRQKHKLRKEVVVEYIYAEFR